MLTSESSMPEQCHLSDMKGKSALGACLEKRQPIQFDQVVEVLQSMSPQVSYLQSLPLTGAF